MPEPRPVPMPEPDAAAGARAVPSRSVAARSAASARRRRRRLAPSAPRSWPRRPWPRAWAPAASRPAAAESTGCGLRRNDRRRNDRLHDRRRRLAAARPERSARARECRRCRDVRRRRRRPGPGRPRPAARSITSPVWRRDRRRSEQHDEQVDAARDSTPQPRRSSRATREVRVAGKAPATIRGGGSDDCSRLSIGLHSSSDQRLLAAERLRVTWPSYTTNRRGKGFACRPDLSPTADVSARRRRKAHPSSADALEGCCQLRTPGLLRRRRCAPGVSFGGTPMTFTPAPRATSIASITSAYFTSGSPFTKMIFSGRGS